MSTFCAENRKRGYLAEEVLGALKRARKNVSCSRGSPSDELSFCSETKSLAKKRFFSDEGESSSDETFGDRRAIKRIILDKVEKKVHQKLNELSGSGDLFEARAQEMAEEIVDAALVALEKDVTPGLQKIEEEVRREETSHMDIFKRCEDVEQELASVKDKLEEETERRKAAQLEAASATVVSMRWENRWIESEIKCQAAEAMVLFYSSQSSRCQES